MPVEIVHWNPSRPVIRGKLGKLLPVRRPINNFGDVLGPVLVAEILRASGLSNIGKGRLLTVGSIMNFSVPGDVVWGSGVNGKVVNDRGGAPDLDVRAVRGPETRHKLIEWGVQQVPDIYGDPGLLWSRFWPQERYLTRSRNVKVTIVPNLFDIFIPRRDERVVDPRAPLQDVISRIANSELVIGSSLHGIIIAESFGIPARLISSENEPAFKYRDYYFGTGRMNYSAASSIEEAIEMGGEPPALWEPQRLLDAFPYDLFTNEREE